MPATDYKYDVFLSYSSKDKAVVRAVAERLRAQGLRVWFDEWVIRAGDNIPAKIEEGLEHSRVLVLCMSAPAFDSEWASLESQTFRFRDPMNKARRLIPLRLDQAPIKGSLAQLHYIDWREDREHGFANLLEACRPPVIPEVETQVARGQEAMKATPSDEAAASFLSDGLPSVGGLHGNGHQEFLEELNTQKFMPQRHGPRANKRFSHFSLGLSTVLMLIILGYLIVPLLSRRDRLEAGASPEILADDYLYDWFIVRDAYRSIHSKSVRSLENSILSYVRPAAGDRVTLADFGADPIQPPISSIASLEGLSHSGSQSSDPTDFVRLFDRLREAVRDDRKDQRMARRPAHADAVVIFTDGVSDPSMSCPRPGHEFISRDIVEAFKALMSSVYDTQEPIFVRFVLVETPGLCGAKIQQAWENSLHPVAGAGAFEVLSYLENPERFLQSLRRQPHTVLKLAEFPESERSKLDRGERFSVEYSAWSLLNGGEIQVASASLLSPGGSGIGGEITVLPFGDRGNLGSPVVIAVPPPADPGKYLLSDPVRGRIHFTFLQRESVSEFDDYEMTLRFSSTSPLEVRPAAIEIAPSSSSVKKKIILQRLDQLKIWPAAIALVLFLGAVAPNLLAGALRRRVRAQIEEHLVHPYLLWAALLFSLLLPASATFFLLSKWLLLVACIGIGLSVAFLVRLRESSTMCLLSLASGFLALSVVIEMAT